MRVAIVGTGAVGTALWFYLSRYLQKANIVLLQKQGWLSKECFVTDPEGHRVTLRPGGLPAGRVDVAFIATRAFDVLKAARDLQSSVCADVIITLNNGYVVDQIADAGLCPGVTTLAAADLIQGWQITNANPTLIWGSVDGAAGRLVELELATLPGFERQKKILPFVRRKWLFNTVINGLCAVNDCDQNGALLRRQQQIDEVLHECYCLGLELWGDWPWTEVELQAQTIELIEATAANLNSTVRDLRQGQKTEMAYLAGLVGGRIGYPWLQKLRSF